MSKVLLNQFDITFSGSWDNSLLNDACLYLPTYSNNYMRTHIFPYYNQYGLALFTCQHHCYSLVHSQKHYQ
jgi:hypothetical protein